MGWLKKLFRSSEESRENNQGSQLAKDLSSLYDEISLVSERIQSCNSDFIQNLHEKFEKDKKYKNFKAAVLSICWTVIQDEPNLSAYIIDLDQEIEKLNGIVQEAIKGFDDGIDFWKALAENAGQDRFAEISEAFWAEHFLTAQRFVLGAWIAKQKGDPLYIYKGPE